MHSCPEQHFFILSPDLLCTIDLQGQLIRLNPAMEKRIRGLDSTLGKTSFLDFVHPHDYQIAQDALQSLTTKQTTVCFAVRYESEQPVTWTFTLQPQEYLIYAIGTQRSQEEAERQTLEQAKQTLVSIVSHELRTPLTTIHGSLSLLVSGRVEVQQRDRLVQIAAASSDRLVRLINDLVDLESVDSEVAGSALQYCNAAELMSKAVVQVQGLANQSNIGVSMQVLEVSLWGDPSRLIQVLTHLLRNAIQFSASGSTVWLNAERQGDQILFQVRDSGRGILAEHRERIFDLFQQVDSSASRPAEGIGLGLALCRKIVQQHQGKIWVESDLGTGSTFYFTIPVA